MNLSLNHAKTLVDPEFKHVLEFGVFKGVTLTQLRKIFTHHFSVFGFDSFCGLPEDWVNKDGKVSHKKGQMSAHGKIPDVPGTKIYEGFFNKTIPEYLAEHISSAIALLHVDCDLYSSTKEVLFGLNRNIRPGTIIVFDEWIYRHHPDFDDHEQKAFYDWCTMCNRKCELIDFKDTSHCGEERKIVKVIT